MSVVNNATRRRYAPSGPYGLMIGGEERRAAAASSTSDVARAHRVSDALDAGTVWINTWFALPAGQPLGGFKRSGFGREMCAKTLHEYTAPKAISMRIDPERRGLWR